MNVRFFYFFLKTSKLKMDECVIKALKESLSSNMINIKEFDLSKMKRDATVCVIGPRRTGKSYLTRDIMYHHQNIPAGVVLSGTEKVDPFFKKFIPNSYIFEKYDQNYVQNLISSREEIISKKDGRKDPSDNIFFIMDDMISQCEDWKNDKTIKELFLNGRHYNILFILTMQYIKSIGPMLRGNFDYVFLFKNKSQEERLKIFQSFVSSVIPSKNDFYKIFDVLTKDHCCMVIDFTTESNSIEDSIFWYKASLDIEPFKVGGPDYWAIEDKYGYDQTSYNRSAIEMYQEINSVMEDIERYGDKNTTYKLVIPKDYNN